MAEYVGRRIVPRHDGVWDIRREYEELMVVLDTDSGDSYISRIPVPAGTAISDEKYWMLFSLYSAQIEEAEKHLKDTAKAIREELSSTEERIGKSLSDTEGRVSNALSETEGRVGNSLEATENRLNARVDAAREDLGAKVTEAAGELSDGLSRLAETDKSLNARMDAIASGATGDREVLDARVDSEGETHASLGEAVRSIYPKVKEEMEGIKEQKFDRVYDATGEPASGIVVNVNTGLTQEFSDSLTTDFIQIDPACQKAYYTGRVFNWIGIAGYNAQGDFVASILDSRDTEEPREYQDEELVIPEGVTQIRASSYHQDMRIRIVGESAKLWERVRLAHSRLDGKEKEIENLRQMDTYLAEEAMNRAVLSLLYGKNQVWSASSPILTTYYVPLTVLKNVYIETMDFTIRTTGATKLTVTIELGENTVLSQDIQLGKGDIPVSVQVGRFLNAGAYKMRLKAEDKVLCYPIRTTDAAEIRNEYFSNEPSGDVTYDFANRLIVFLGTITIRSGGVDNTLSISGLPADAAAVGERLEEAKRTMEAGLRGKLDKVRGLNLLDPDKYRPGWFAFKGSSKVTFHADNLRYGATDYIPVSEKGLVTKNSGINGVTSQIVYDSAYTPLRFVDANDQYTYEEGDAYVVFCYHSSTAEKIAVVEGTEYVFEAYTEFKPLNELEGQVSDLKESVEGQVSDLKEAVESQVSDLKEVVESQGEEMAALGKSLDGLGSRIEALEEGPAKKDLALVPAAPVYTVCNDLNLSRNYHTSVWIDHLVSTVGWKDVPAGFGEQMDQGFALYSPFTNTAVNGGEDVLEQTVKKSFVSDAYHTQELTFTHRSTLASMGRTLFPKILVLGDSVTDGYCAGVNKADKSLPNHYWAWVRYLFELDRQDAGGSEEEFNCLMVGMLGYLDGKKYGSSNSFTFGGNSYRNFAVGKGGWSAEDLNLATFEGDGNINPFYEEETGKFSLKAGLAKYRTLADDGVTRLAAGETAGSEVTNPEAYDLCTPTHVVINLNHNSSLAEYQETIPGVVETIKAEYPDMVVILMSIDETGTFFPAKYPQYAPSEITIGSLHKKNLDIYRYICEELQDEARGIYVCSGHLVQPPVESYPTIEYAAADSVGRDAAHTLRTAYGRGQYGGPNWHPNNYAHCAWGYQLYALVKYTLALQEME